MAPLKLSCRALLKLSYVAPTKLSCKDLLKQSYMALLYPSSSAPDLSYTTLSSSSPRVGMCGFNADLWSVRGFNEDLWRIGTDCVAFQASRFLYK